MGVAIKGVIPITAKMAPQRQIIKLQWRWHKRWQNAIQGFGVTYLATLERKKRGCKIAVGGYCSSQRLYSTRFSDPTRGIDPGRGKGQRVRGSTGSNRGSTGGIDPVYI